VVTVDDIATTTMIRYRFILRGDKIAVLAIGT
jgi:hypothetical protein